MVGRRIPSTRPPRSVQDARQWCRSGGLPDVVPETVITINDGRNPGEPVTTADDLRPVATRRPSWRTLRAASGLSLRELEEQVGINRGLLSRIEHGFGPTPDQARRLLAVYDGAR